MLKRAMKQIHGDVIIAREGEIGSVKDLYFDDERWAVRYLVVDTGNWLPGRKVLVSPASIERRNEDAVQVALSREQVKQAPGIDQDPPISRILERAYAQFYGYPYYWDGPLLWGEVPVPVAAPPAERAQQSSPAALEAQRTAEQRARESHVRSGNEVLGYAIRATDGEIGHVEDLMVDDDTCGMVVDTRNWLPGKKVVVSPEQISEVDWARREVAVRLKRDDLKNAPLAH